MLKTRTWMKIHTKILSQRIWLLCVGHVTSHSKSKKNKSIQFKQTLGECCVLPFFPFHISFHLFIFPESKALCAVPSSGPIDFSISSLFILPKIGQHIPYFVLCMYAHIHTHTQRPMQHMLCVNEWIFPHRNLQSTAATVATAVSI